MFIDQLTIKGSVKVQLFDANGNLKQEHEDHNLVVTAGKVYLATWLTAASQAGYFMSYVGLGEGDTAPAASDTALEDEFSGGGYTRVQSDLVNLSSTRQSTSIFGPGNGTGSVAEAGMFSASTAGSMFSRHTFLTPYDKHASDTLTVIWTISFS